ncbi:hypothetical protein TDB9533_01004 [Thalassocella blandensis]|nr:hypothetical protein TDB9533_01004 [Thalassocella blandensis]
MSKLIKDKVLADNEWTVINEGDSTAAGQKSILPLSDFIALAEKNEVDFNTQACWLGAADEAELLAPYIKDLQLIGLNFTAFMDGRSFSQARTLREHLDFAGELRAIGYFIQDQMFYLTRCGVNAFEIPDDADIESLQRSLTDFSESYQAACDEPQPLYRRRV